MINLIVKIWFVNKNEGWVEYEIIRSVKSGGGALVNEMTPNMGVRTLRVFVGLILPHLSAGKFK